MFEFNKIFGGHNSEVTSVCVSADNTKIASADVSGNIVIRNKNTRKIIKRLDEVHSSRINHLKWSGDKLVSCSSDGNILVFSVLDWSLLFTLNFHFSDVTDINFSPDGKKLISCGGDNRIRYWNLENGSEIYNIIEVGVVRTCFSPDGTKILVGKNTGELKVYTESTKMEYRSNNSIFNNSITGLNTNPAHDDVVFVCSAGQKLKVWDYINDLVIDDFSSDISSNLYGLDISNSGEKIIIASEGTSGVYLFDYNEKNLSHNITSHGTSVINCAVFSKDGNEIVCGASDKKVSITNSALGSEIMAFSGHQDDVNCVSFNPGGISVATASKDKTIKIWDILTGSTLKTISGFKNGIKSLSYDKTGNYILVAEEGTASPSLFLINAFSYEIEKTFSGHSDSVNKILFSNENDKFFTFSWDKTIKVWSFPECELLETIVNDYSFRDGDISKDGSFIVGVTAGIDSKFYSATTYQQIGVINSTGTNNPSVSVSEDKIAISSLGNKTISVFDLATRTLLKTFSLGTYFAFKLKFTNNDTLISSSSDKKIRYFDLSGTSDNWKELSVITNAHSEDFWALDFKGDYLASAGNDNVLKIWNLSEEAAPKSLSGHNNEIFFMEFFDNGSKIVTCSLDNTIKFWDAQTKRIITGINPPGNIAGTLETNNMPIFSNSAVVTSDKTKMYVAYEKGIIEYSLTEMKELRKTVFSAAPELSSFAAPYCAISLSPDETKVVICGMDGNNLKMVEINLSDLSYVHSNYFFANYYPVCPTDVVHLDNTTVAVNSVSRYSYGDWFSTCLWKIDLTSKTELAKKTLDHNVGASRDYYFSVAYFRKILKTSYGVFTYVHKAINIFKDTLPTPNADQSKVFCYNFDLENIGSFNLETPSSKNKYNDIDYSFSVSDEFVFVGNNDSLLKIYKKGEMLIGEKILEFKPESGEVGQVKIFNDVLAISNKAKEFSVFDYSNVFSSDGFSDSENINKLKPVVFDNFTKIFLPKKNKLEILNASDLKVVKRKHFDVPMEKVVISESGDKIFVLFELDNKIKIFDSDFNFIKETQAFARSGNLYRSFDINSDGSLIFTVHSSFGADDTSYNLGLSFSGGFFKVIDVNTDTVINSFSKNFVSFISTYPNKYQYVSDVLFLRDKVVVAAFEGDGYNYSTTYKTGNQWLTVDIENSTETSLEISVPSVSGDTTSLFMQDYQFLFKSNYSNQVATCSKSLHSTRATNNNYPKGLFGVGYDIPSSFDTEFDRFVKFVDFSKENALTLTNKNELQIRSLNGKVCEFFELDEVPETAMFLDENGTKVLVLFKQHGELFDLTTSTSNKIERSKEFQDMKSCAPFFINGDSEIVYSKKGGILYIHNFETGEFVKEIKMEVSGNFIRGQYLSGEKVALITDKGTVLIYDFSSETIINQIDTGIVYLNMAISRDMSKIAVCANNYFCIYDSDLNEISHGTFFSNNVYCAEFNETGESLLVSGSDNYLRVFRVSDAVETTSFPMTWARSIKLNSDETRLYIACSDNNVKVYAFPAMTLLKSWALNYPYTRNYSNSEIDIRGVWDLIDVFDRKYFLASMAFSGYYVFKDDGMAEGFSFDLLTPVSSRLQRSVDSSNGNIGNAWYGSDRVYKNRYGNIVTFSNGEEEVFTVDLKKEQFEDIQTINRSNTPNYLIDTRPVISKNGTYAAFYTQKDGAGENLKHLMIRNLDTNAILHERVFANYYNSHDLWASAYITKDNSKVIIREERNGCKVYSLPDMTEVLDLTHNVSSRYSREAVVSPNEKYLAYITDDFLYYGPIYASVWVFDLETGEKIINAANINDEGDRNINHSFLWFSDNGNTLYVFDTYSREVTWFDLLSRTREGDKLFTDIFTTSFFDRNHKKRCTPQDPLGRFGVFQLDNFGKNVLKVFSLDKTNTEFLQDLVLSGLGEICGAEYSEDGSTLYVWDIFRIAVINMNDFSITYNYIPGYARGITISDDNTKINCIYNNHSFSKDLPLSGLHKDYPNFKFFGDHAADYYVNGSNVGLLKTYVTTNNLYTVTAGVDQNIKIFENSTGRIIQNIGPTYGLIQGVSLTEDASYLTWGIYWDKSIYVLDLTKKDVNSPEIPIEAVRKFVFSNYVKDCVLSPDNTKLLVCCSGGYVAILNFPELTLFKEYLGHTNDVYCGCFSNDGSKFATVSSDASVRYWEVETGYTLKQFLGHDSTVRIVSFSDDDSMLVSSDQNKISVWDLSNKELFKDFVTGMDTPHVSLKNRKLLAVANNLLEINIDTEEVENSYASLTKRYGFAKKTDSFTIISETTSAHPGVLKISLTSEKNTPENGYSTNLSKLKMSNNNILALSNEGIYNCFDLKNIQLLEYTLDTVDFSEAGFCTSDKVVTSFSIIDETFTSINNNEKYIYLSDDSKTKILDKSNDTLITEKNMVFGYIKDTEEVFLVDANRDVYLYNVQNDTSDFVFSSDEDIISVYFYNGFLYASTQNKIIKCNIVSKLTTEFQVSSSTKVRVFKGNVTVLKNDSLIVLKENFDKVFHFSNIIDFESDASYIYMLYKDGNISKYERVDFLENEEFIANADSYSLKDIKDNGDTIIGIYSTGELIEFSKSDSSEAVLLRKVKTVLNAASKLNINSNFACVINPGTGASVVNVDTFEVVAHINKDIDNCFVKDGFIYTTKNKTLEKLDFSLNVINSHIVNTDNDVFSCELSGNTLILCDSLGYLYKVDMEGNIEIKKAIHNGPAKLIYKNGMIISFGQQDGVVKLIYPETLKTKNSFLAHSSKILHVDLSPNSNFLTTAGDDKLIKIYNIEKTFLSKEINSHSGYACNLLMFKSNHELLTFADDKNLFLNDTKSLSLLSISSGHANYVTATVLDPTGEIAVSGDADGWVNIWDVVLKTFKKGFSAHSSKVSAIGFNSTGEKYFTVSLDKTLKIWDKETSENLATINAHSNKVSDAFVINDFIITVSGDDTDKNIKVFNFEGELENTIACDPSYPSPISVSASRDSAILAALSSSRLHTINFSTGLTINNKAVSNATDCEFTEDFIVVSTSTGTLTLYDKNSLDVVKEKTGLGNIIKISSLDSGDIALVNVEGKLTVLDLNLEIKKSTTIHNSKVNCISFDASEKLVITGSDDKSVKIFENGAGELKWISFLPHSTQINELKFNPSENIAISGSDSDTIVRTWDVSTGTLLNNFSGNGYGVQCIEFLSDEEVVVYWYGRMMRLLNITTGDVLTEFSFLTSFYDGFMIKSFGNGQFFALAGGDGNLTVYQKDSATPLRSIAVNAVSGNLRSLDFNSKEDKVMVSDSNAKKIKIYNFINGDLLLDITTDFTTNLSNCVFSQDEKSAIAISETGEIKSYDIKTGLLIKNINSLKSENPTSVYEFYSNSTNTRLFVQTNLGLKVVDFENDIILETLDVSVNAFDINKENAAFLLGKTNGVIKYYEDPDISPPPIPINFDYSNVTDETATLTWQASGSETGFELEYKLASDDVWTLATNITESFIVIDSLNQFSDYKARIRAYKTTGAGDKISAFTSSLSFKTKLSPPSNLSSNVSGRDISVSFTPNPLSTQNKIFTKKGSNPYDQGTIFLGNRYDMVGDEAASYLFKIKPMISLYEGELFSEEVLAVTAPKKPTGLNVFQIGSNAFLSWNSAAGATSYEVYMRQNDNAYELIDEVGGTNYTISSITGGGTFYFRIKSKNASGTSLEYSDQVVLKTAPNPPQNVSASGKDQRVVLYWDAVPNALYKVFYKYGAFDFVEIISNLSINKFTTYNLANGTEYTFKVKAYNEAGDSDYSAEVKATPVPLIVPDTVYFYLEDRFNGSSKSFSSTKNPRYSFEITKQEDEIKNSIRIILDGAKQDLTLFLLNEAEEIIAYSDDAFGEVGASKIAKELCVGKYYIVCATFKDENENTDKFGLSVSGKFINNLIKLEGFSTQNIPVTTPAAVLTTKDGIATYTWDSVSFATSYEVYTKELDNFIFVDEVFGTNYSFPDDKIEKVFAFKSKSSSGDSNFSALKKYPEEEIITPQKPSNVKYSIIGNICRIRWDLNASAKEYVLKINGDVHTTSNNYYDLENFTPNKLYACSIRSASIEGVLSDKYYFNIIQSIAAETTIENLRGYKFNSDVKLTWESLGNVFKVFVKIDDAPYKTIASISEKTFTYTLEHGKKYSFAVSSSDNGVNSSLKYLHIDAIPKAPEFLTGSFKNDTLSLSWKISKNSSSYNVYKLYGTNYTKLNNTPITINNFTCTVEDGEIFEYVVRAVNSTGESSDSDKLSF